MKVFRQKYTLYVYPVYKIHISVKGVIPEIFFRNDLSLFRYSPLLRPGKVCQPETAGRAIYYKYDYNIPVI